MSKLLGPSLFDGPPMIELAPGSCRRCGKEHGRRVVAGVGKGAAGEGGAVATRAPPRSTSGMTLATDSGALVLLPTTVLELLPVCRGWWGWRTEAGDWWLVRVGTC